MAKRLCTLAFAGVLLFGVVAPVPLLSTGLDDPRYEQAHANAAAVTGMAVLGTVALAYGISLAGSTITGYDANLQGMYDYIGDFMNDNYDASAETALLGCLTPLGAVNVGLASQQLKNAISAYVQNGLNNGDIVYGSDSSLANQQTGTLLGITFKMGAVLPANVEAAIKQNYNLPSDYSFIGVEEDEWGTHDWYFCNSTTLDVYKSGNYLVTNNSTMMYFRVDPTTGRYWNNNRHQLYVGAIVTLADGVLLKNGSQEAVYDSQTIYDAVVDEAVFDGIDSASGIYDVFSPTTAQLQQGISDSDLIDAVNIGNGYAQNTLDGVNAIIGQFTALLSSVGTIGDVIGNVGEDVASIPSVLDDVLEGVLSIPDALSTGLAGVVSAVNAIPASIAGVLEGVTFPIQFPTLPEYDYTGTVQLPLGAWDSFQLEIRDKAPFCYFPRMYNALASWWNMANVRSFYFDVPLPDGSGQSYVQRFDAEDILSVEYGSTDVASIIRTMVTISLCFALLYAAVSIAIWSVKGA